MPCHRLTRFSVVALALRARSTSARSFVPPPRGRRAASAPGRGAPSRPPRLLPALPRGHCVRTHHGLSLAAALVPAAPYVAGTLYFFLANALYLWRRAHIRQMPKRQLLRIRLVREEGVGPSLHLINLCAWQLFVNVVFPFSESIASLCFGYVSFYYFYPNAGGFGIVFEPLSAQSLSLSQRTRSQVRCDWHRFSVNVGAVGRDGYRHPPSVSRNAPHVDIPRRGWKHWPWRRRHAVRDGRGT